MTGGAVLRAASAGVTRRLVPTVVIFLVLTAGSAAALLGLTLVTNSNELFLTAFTRAHGAQLAVTVDTAKATPAQLARARELPGVTQAAGPYPQTYLKLRPAHAAGPGPGHGTAGPVPHGQVNPLRLTPDMWLSVVGRAAPSGRLDDIALQQGRWATRPGEIDIDPHFLPFPAPIGAKVTVTSAPGKPELTVVGYASSIAPDEDAWVAPSQIAALRPAGAPAQQQMLYTFAQAGNATQVAADLARVEAALPAGAVHSWVSWLSANSTDRRFAGGQHAVRGHLRGHRPGAGRADHGQRGRRRGDRRLPADRRAQVHRVHPRPGHRRLPGPDRPARPRRGCCGHRARRLAGAAADQRRQQPVQHQRDRPAVDRNRGAGGDAGTDRAGRGRARHPGRAAERGAGNRRRAGPAPAAATAPTGCSASSRCPAR